jgi:hypothetical protein
MRWQQALVGRLVPRTGESGSLGTEAPGGDGASALRSVVVGWTLFWLQHVERLQQSLRLLLEAHQAHWKKDLKKKNTLLLWLADVGFLVLIALCWANQVLDLPRHLLGGTSHSNWRESVMETILILIVWAGVRVFTKRLLRRLYYLESFPRICAWCRNLSHEDEWLPLEEYFAEGFHVEASHGICPACRARMLSEHAATVGMSRSSAL